MWHLPDKRKTDCDLWDRKSDKKLEKWEGRIQGEQEKLSYTDRIQAKSDCDWIMPVLLTKEGQSIQIQRYQVADLLEQEAQRQTEYLIQEQELLQFPESTHPDPAAWKQLEEQLTFPVSI